MTVIRETEHDRRTFGVPNRMSRFLAASGRRLDMLHSRRQREVE